MSLSTQDLPLSLDKLLDLALESKASDIHLKSNLPPAFRIDGRIKAVPGWPAISGADLRKSLIGLLNPKQQEKFEREMELDTAIVFEDKARVRVNLYMDIDSIGAAMRVVPLEVPTIGQLALPPVVEKLTHARSGLILVTGVTGAGKSTTLAAMVDAINEREPGHIYTIEDPVEFVHRSKKSVVTQREIGFSTKSFAGALRAALRADPNVILIGEMRDTDTILNALKAAETGLLVLSTLHTQSAPKTIQRILGAFDPGEQEAVRTQLAHTLRAVIAQQLIPVRDGGRMAVHEIMVNTLSIQEAILGQEIESINEFIRNGGYDGMQTMDGAILTAYKDGLIDADTARSFAIDGNEMDRILKGAMKN
jgi:twitching motility protein PilT